MDSDGLAAADLDDALSVLLTRVPDAVLIALTDTVTRMPLPATDRFRSSRPCRVIGPHLVDVVVPAGRMQVVTTWERAQRHGMAQGEVRALSEPDRALRLVFIDARHSLGVWIGVLAGAGQWRSGEPGPVLDGALLVPRLPRTATMHKNLYAIITDIDDRVPLMLG